MLTTTGFQNFGFEFDSTMLTILPGAARMGNSVLSFDGTIVSYDNITQFDTANMYQNSLLYLHDLGGAADMTQVLSDETSSIRGLDIPSLPSDATFTYAPVHPLGMFTFYNDGTEVSLISYNKI